MRLILLFLLILLVLPYTGFFPHVFVNVHDNLDIDVVRYMLAARSQYLFASNDTIIPEMMGGLPRLVFDSQFYYPIWLFYFFHPYKAVIINMVLVHVVAFISIYLLGKYFLKQWIESNVWLHIWLFLLAITFAYQQEQHLLNLGLGIAAAPLFLLSILRIYRHEHQWWDNGIVFVFPFVSRLTHTGFFWMFFIGLFWITDAIKNKKVNKDILRVLLLLIIGYVIVEYRLLSALLIEHFQSHRYEFNLNKLTAVQVVRKMWEFFWWGDYQARSLNYVGWFLLLAMLIFYYTKKLSVNKKERQIVFLIFGAMLFCIAISAVSKYEKLNFIFRHFNFFDLSRFAFLLPTFSVLLILCVVQLFLRNFDKQHFRTLIITLYLIVFVALGVTIKYNHTIKDFVKQIVHLGKPEVNNPDYFYLDEFFATDLFEHIKHDLPAGRDTYRVASIGLHPALALFNGFYTIDGAIANYPLFYKRKFRQIIADEIGHHSQLIDYYDHYGCRVYLFSKDLESLYNTDKNKIIYPTYNTNALRSFNCKYIFSAVKIGNTDVLQWKALHQYQNKNYTIYVYEIL